MRANLNFVRTRFDYFNRLCFNNTLPEINIVLSDSIRMLGVFVVKRNADRGIFNRITVTKEIRISRRFDVDESIIEDTLLHEMIHYYIWFKKLRDSSPHGEIFKSEMNRINCRYGRNIKIRHHDADALNDTDTRIMKHYILVTAWKDGKILLTQVASTRLFEIYKDFIQSDKVNKVELYLSFNPWFNRFPTCRSAKAYRIDKEILKDKLTGSTRYIMKDGDKFILTKNNSEIL